MSVDLASYRDVGDPAALERKGLFVAEGRLVVGRLLLDDRYRVHSVLVTDAAAAALQAVFESRPDVPVHTCGAAELEEITGFDFHRGCLALAYRPEHDVHLSSLALATRALALEGIGNPDNIGGLFRAAFALGADAVLLDSATADPLYRKAIRTSMAATLRLPFARVSPWPDGLEPLRANGFRIVALTPHPDADTLEAYASRADDRIVLVVGSEGAGLTAATLAYADLQVRIPIDSRADSLNVVTAAAIALQRLRC